MRDSFPIDIEGPDDSRPTEKKWSKITEKKEGKEKNIYIQNTALERGERFYKVYEKNTVKVESTEKEMCDQIESLVLCRE